MRHINTSDLTPERMKLFWKKVRKTDDCWEWTAAKISFGYGYFSFNGKNCVVAHRVSWTDANGEIPEGKIVLHKCDNSACVRPSHLFIGTFDDNSKDMVRKGRQAKGESNGGGVKLTDKAIREIRIFHKMDFSHETIAKLYGVHRRTIKEIALGRRWRHVR